VSETRPYRLSDRYTAERGTVFLTGIQALARIPIEQLRADRRAGRNTAAFVSGYPGSPLGGFDRAVAEAARLVPELPIVCRPALNEEYAATAVMGSQLANAQRDALYDGVVGIWYGKSPGVDRATDALRHAVYAGTSRFGGAVALVGDDPNAKSSTLPSSSAGALADLHMPLLYPSDPEEALDLGRHAVALSRATGLWAALKIVADVADGTAVIHLDPDRVAPVAPTLHGAAYSKPPEGRLLTPRTLELEREIYEVRYALAIQYASENALNRAVVDPADAWIGIVASGITYREVREALHRLGLGSVSEIARCGIRLLKMQMPIPFDPRTVRHFARGLLEVFVIEEKQPNLESLIKDALYSLPHRPRVVGKTDERDAPLLPGWGGLDADSIVPALHRRLAQRAADRIAPAPPAPGPRRAPLAMQRMPYYCSGCPHNRSTETPRGALVGAGIGCHTMVVLMDPERVGDIAGVTPMGNEGAQWIGMSEFIERDHFIQNLGDGTFFHSGQLAIQASVAAGVNVTYKLLYNGAIAMTGGQHPQGQIGVPEVAKSLLAHGVARVLVTTDDAGRYRGVELPAGVEVWPRDRLIEAQELLAKVPGVTVLIHDQACAAELRRARKRGMAPTPDQRVVINHRICEGCGDCGRVSGCLSVQPLATPFGRKTSIDQTTCNLDFSCLEGDCPSFVTVSRRPPRRLRGLFASGRRAAVPARATAPRPAAAPPGAPAPRRIVPDQAFALRITGIGGTGVVTVAQVLGTAAMFDGYEVRGLDQIGLSQKAGPVVSDLRLSRKGPPDTNRLGAGQADLLLAFDLLVAAAEQGLLVTAPGRTAVVGSTSATPTGAMITHPELGLPPVGTLLDRIGRATRADAQHWADADALVTALFGDAQTANLFVVGMALQAGCLPIAAASIERAIALNGVAVEANTAAFRWGRSWIHAPEALEAATAKRLVGVEAEGAGAALDAGLAARIGRIAAADAGLETQLARFGRELVAFQDAALAESFLACVEEVAAVERRVAPGSSRLLRAVSANLYKLLAYKDEYEVARLMLDAGGMREARELAGPGGRIAWRLHPPVLRALGLGHKISLGPWAAPFVRLLAKGKRLRGTRIDPFGWTEVRRQERELPGEYRAAVQDLLAGLRAENLGEAVRIAELPDAVRGYEGLKLARSREYRSQLRGALERYRRPA
jgi:indolepyruvate ferredoxin oxidoreductase